MSLFIVERGPMAGKRIPMNQFPATVGRDASCTITIDDKEVSRVHCRIKKRERIYVIEDLDSRNGTHLNGDRILNAELHSGDKILIGQTELVFLSAESYIHLAHDLAQLDMLVSEDLGVDGPIALSEGQDVPKNYWDRIPASPQKSLDLSDLKPSRAKELFDWHADLVLAQDMHECAQMLLKCMGKIFPEIGRAGFFVWHKQGRLIIPKATKHFKKKASFHLSRRAFEDVIGRKHAVLIQGDAPNVTQSGKNRLIVPLMHGNDAIAVLHLETDHPKVIFPKESITFLLAFLARSASVIDSLLLREELDSWMVGMIESMVAALEAKDTYTHGHSERVSRYTMAIADELKLSRDLKKLLLMSSLCHDIGKVGIPDSILKKASMLSTDEYEEMKQHPLIGERIIMHMPHAKRILSGVKYHHERWDGTGYPDGLEGENIPFFGRIVGVADAFDAMVSGRSYSGFVDQGDAVDKLGKEKDMFDPEIRKAFVRAYEKGNLTQKTTTQNNQVPGAEPDDHARLSVKTDKALTKKKPA